MAAPTWNVSYVTFVIDSVELAQNDSVYLSVCMVYQTLIETLELVDGIVARQSLPDEEHQVGLV